MGAQGESIGLLDELEWRGLLFQCTDERRLREHLADPENAPRRGYAGFDPTADSLTIGNLVPIMALVHLARAGHEPIVIAGGGTGLIGDPSGKSDERRLMTPDRVAANVESIRGIFERVFTGAGLGPPPIENNLDWLGELRYVDVLRDVGKHFSVNQMIQKDSVRERLETREQGISYTEFSYMVLQAYDFLHLYTHERVTLQIGGSDQWGNIVEGEALIRRWDFRQMFHHIHEQALKEQPIADESGARRVSLAGFQDAVSKGPKGEGTGSYGMNAFGLTVPLITKADGGKFGKTESGAVWLSAHRTSPYAYYQFWLNADDADVIRFLRIFTLLDRTEIDRLERAHDENPGAREAHRTLAHEATRILHGEDEARAAEAASRALFSGEIGELPEPTLREVFAEVPSSAHDRSRLAGEGADLIDVLVETGLAQSKREAREFLQNGSVSVNGVRVEPGRRLTEADLLHDELIALRRGKKRWHLTRWGPVRPE